MKLIFHIDLHVYTQVSHNVKLGINLLIFHKTACINNSVIKDIVYTLTGIGNAHGT